MWIGVLWAGLRVAMWITHVGGKFRHGLPEKSLIFHRPKFAQKNNHREALQGWPRQEVPWPILLAKKIPRQESVQA